MFEARRQPIHDAQRAGKVGVEQHDRELPVLGLSEQVGLADVADGELVVSAEYEGFEDLWEPFTAGVGPAGAYAVSLDPERQAALREEYQRRLDVPDGDAHKVTLHFYQDVDGQLSDLATPAGPSVQREVEVVPARRWRARLRKRRLEAALIRVCRRSALLRRLLRPKYPC